LYPPTQSVLFWGSNSYLNEFGILWQGWFI
jgi:hypothetical protein